MGRFLIVFVIIFSAFRVVAQSNSDEQVLVKSIYGMERRDLIARHIVLSESQVEVFWQLYDAYELERREIGLKRARNIAAYASKYERLTNEEADLLMKTTFEVNVGFAQLWDKTYKKMSKAVSPVTAAQFIQAEMFIEHMIRQELALDIPLIGEFELKN